MESRRCRCYFRNTLRIVDRWIDDDVTIDVEGILRELPHEVFDSMTGIKRIDPRTLQLKTFEVVFNELESESVKEITKKGPD